jgi:signal transduction histidine kinase
MEKTSTDIAELVKDIAKRAASIEELLRVRVECPNELPMVDVDQERITRAITNLITNALKYSPTEMPVYVRLHERDGEAIISVIDEGVGIDAEEIPNLFQRFFRAKTGKKIEGLGLGLYITRLIIEAHGGRIWVESQVGKGSTFNIALPLSRSGVDKPDARTRIERGEAEPWVRD